MSAVWVRRDEAERGGVPARCARSGERCITRYRRRVSELPAALEWVTWTGLWPRDTDRPAPEVVLPALPRQQRLHQVLRGARDSSAVLLGLALVGALLLGGMPGEVARVTGVVALGVHLLAAALGWGLTVEIRLDTTGDWIWLSGVHPEFVQATEAVTTRPTDPPTLAEASLGAGWLPRDDDRTATEEQAGPGGSTAATDG